MRKLKNPVLFLFIAGTICAAGTAAYFSDSDNRINEVAVGTVTTEIEENFPDPTPTPMENNPSYRKEIWTGNFSSSEKGFNADCYVRMMVSYSDDDIGRGVEILGMDTVNWVYSNEDGYYYYRNVRKEKRRRPYVQVFGLIQQKLMIHIKIVFQILQSIYTKNLYRQKDLRILKVHGDILIIRYLEMQKGGGMVEKSS